MNAILSLLQPLDRYRTPSAIGSAIGRPLSRPISHPNTVVGVLNRLVLNRLGGSSARWWRYSVQNPLKTSAKQKRDRGRDSQPRPRPRLISQPQGATKDGSPCFAASPCKLFDIARIAFWPLLSFSFRHNDFQKTFPGRVRVKFAQNEGHEKPRKSHTKATKNAQTLFFQADEGHAKATKKPRKVTSKNVTSNEKSSEISCTKQQEFLQESHRSDVATGSAGWPSQTQTQTQRCGALSLCIAIRLPFVSQYFWENLGGCAHRDPHSTPLILLGNDPFGHGEVRV